MSSKKRPFQKESNLSTSILKGTFVRFRESIFTGEKGGRAREEWEQVTCLTRSRWLVSTATNCTSPGATPAPLIVNCVFIPPKVLPITTLAPVSMNLPVTQNLELPTKITSTLGELSKHQSPQASEVIYFGVSHLWKLTWQWEKPFESMYLLLFHGDFPLPY